MIVLHVIIKNQNGYKRHVTSLLCPSVKQRLGTMERKNKFIPKNQVKLGYKEVNNQLYTHGSSEGRV